MSGPCRRGDYAFEDMDIVELKWDSTFRTPLHTWMMVAFTRLTRSSALMSTSSLVRTTSSGRANKATWASTMSSDRLAFCNFPTFLAASSSIRGR